MSGEYSILYSYLRYCLYSYLFIYAPTELWQTLKKIRQAFELSQSVYLPVHQFLPYYIHAYLLAWPLARRSTLSFVRAGLLKRSSCLQLRIELPSFSRAWLLRLLIFTGEHPFGYRFIVQSCQNRPPPTARWRGQLEFEYRLDRSV